MAERVSATALLTVREAVYDGVFSTPKTDAGARQIPLSSASQALIQDWKSRVESAAPDRLRILNECPGHTNVDTTLNVHTQVLDGSLRNAVEEVAGR